MITIPGLYRAFEKLDTEAVILGAFEQSTEGFIEQQKEQLALGLNEEGKLIGDTEAPDGTVNEYKRYVIQELGITYAQLKNEMNPEPGYGNPDLKYTGAFYNGIRVEVNADNINIESTDSKNEALQAKYGSQIPIFGLGGEQKRSFIKKYLRPAALRNISKATGLKINR